TPVADGRVSNKTIVTDLDTISDSRIRNPHAGPNRAAVANRAFALHAHALANNGIPPDHGPRTDVGTSRIDKRDAFEHEARDCAFADFGFHRSKLTSVIDALDLTRIAGLKDRHVLS